MSKVLTDNKHYTDIAAAIREKNGTDDKYKPAEMADAIAAIETGGGGGDLPEEAFNITGDCRYRFAYNGWNWLIDTYGNRIKTSGITNCERMFEGSGRLEHIPFDINCSNTSQTSLAQFIAYCSNVREIPRISGAVVSQSSGIMNYFMYDCKMVRDMPNDYFDEIDFSKITNCGYSFYYLSNGNIFNGCSSLRKIPVYFMRYENPLSSGNTYQYMFCNCYVADEITNIPCPFAADFAKTSNIFSSAFSSVSRANNITFDTVNGTKKQSWKSQTIDLSYNVGYNSYKNYYLHFNSGITADKEVKDDATYQALKNDADWFSTIKEYSRYNRTSAVNTINSLPDTSEYLSTAGGTNTIKFLGVSGSLTDGGAINTMTEEEIAVATAKGWTVSFS